MNPPKRLGGTFGMCNLREGFVNLREGFVVAPWRLREAFSKTRSAKASRSPLEDFAKASRRRHGHLHLETIRQIMTSPRHSHRSCSRLSCDSSLRHRRRNIWVSCSFMRAPANTRQLACLGGRRMNGCMLGATRNYVTNGFLPGVVWANLSVDVLFDTEL